MKTQCISLHPQVGEHDFHQVKELPTQRYHPKPAAAGAPATNGELVQGYLDGQDFLVNCPIDLEALAFARPLREPVVHVRTRGVFSKAAGSVERLMEESGLLNSGWGVELSFVSSVPRGKGLASSTAEVTAALLATARAFNLKPALEELGRISVSQDTSDGVIYPGISTVNQLTGKLLKSMGTPPPMRVIIVDTGGFVDSVSYDRDAARAHAKKFETELRQAVHLVTKGISTGNAMLVGAGATISARLNQALLPKAGFSDILHAALENGAVGVNAAHTGTVLGIMYAAENNRRKSERLRQRIETIVGDLGIIGDYAISPGVGGIHA